MNVLMGERLHDKTTQMTDATSSRLTETLQQNPISQTISGEALMNTYT